MNTLIVTELGNRLCYQTAPFLTPSPKSLKSSTTEVPIFYLDLETFLQCVFAVYIH